MNIDILDSNNMFSNSWKLLLVWKPLSHTNVWKVVAQPMFVNKLFDNKLWNITIRNTLINHKIGEKETDAIKLL